MSKTATLDARLGVKGFFRLQVRRRDGRIRVDTGFFPNLITDAGMDEIGDWNGNGRNRAILVGTGNTPPNIGDTTMEAFVAVTDNDVGLQSQGFGQDPDLSDRYYKYARVTKRFAEGDAAGILAEVGAAGAPASFYSPNNPAVFSRALIVDAGGNPTTITVLSDEILDVTYEIRNYYPVIGAEPSGTFDLSGTSYNFQFVAWEYNSTAGLSVAGESEWYYLSNRLRAFDRDPNDYPGIGPTDSVTPFTGGSDTDSSTDETGISSPYVPGSYRQLGSATFGPSDGNITGGIRTFKTQNTLVGPLWFRVGRTSDDATIPKTNQDELVMVTSITWARL